MKDFYQKSLTLHERLRGKLGIKAKKIIKNIKDLSIVYTPGVAEPCRKIAKETKLAWKYTIKSNTIAVVSDGSAVLGLGNIGPYGAIPVMEGKAILFKQFANIDAWPICLDTQNAQEIIQAVRNIAPVFGGINLEDISSPRCFEIEEKLQDLGIPVFHDDQHGTAIVLLAALINGAKVVGKSFLNLKVVINGSGAAGIAIAKFLSCHGFGLKECISVKDIVVCDSKGIISKARKDLNPLKIDLLNYTNRKNKMGDLKEALKGADAFIGVSKGNLLREQHFKMMNKDPIIFAMANPTPEIMPDKAKKYGAKVIGTGRSDFPNQINNVLAFPGVFRGALDAHAKKITNEMKLKAALALASCVKNPKANKILPNPFDKEVSFTIAEAILKVAKNY